MVKWNENFKKPPRPSVQVMGFQNVVLNWRCSTEYLQTSICVWEKPFRRKPELDYLERVLAVAGRHEVDKQIHLVPKLLFQKMAIANSAGVLTPHS